MTELPDPECRGGYTWPQVRDILGERESDFGNWMSGQTMMICGGEGDCTVAHGMPIVYRWDLERYLSGNPIID